MFGLKHRKARKLHRYKMSKAENQQNKYIVLSKVVFNQDNNKDKLHILTAQSIRNKVPYLTVSIDEIIHNSQYWVNQDELYTIRKNHKIMNKVGTVFVPKTDINKVPLKILDEMQWFEYCTQNVTKLTHKNRKLLVNQQIARNTEFIQSYLKYKSASKPSSSLKNNEYVALLPSKVSNSSGKKVNRYMVLTLSHHSKRQALPVVPEEDLKALAVSYKQLVGIRKDMLLEHWNVSPVILSIDTDTKLVWKKLAKLSKIESLVSYGMVMNNSSRIDYDKSVRRVINHIPMQIIRDKFLLSTNCFF